MTGLQATFELAKMHYESVPQMPVFPNSCEANLSVLLSENTAMNTSMTLRTTQENVHFFHVRLLCEDLQASRHSGKKAVNKLTNHQVKSCQM